MESWISDKMLDGYDRLTTKVAFVEMHGTQIRSALNLRQQNSRQTQEKFLRLENYETQDNRNQLPTAFFAIREIPNLFGNVGRRQTRATRVFLTCIGFYGIFNIKSKEFARWRQAAEYKLKTKHKTYTIEISPAPAELFQRCQKFSKRLFRAQNNFICIPGDVSPRKRGTSHGGESLLQV